MTLSDLIVTWTGNFPLWDNQVVFHNQVPAIMLLRMADASEETEISGFDIETRDFECLCSKLGV